MFLNTDIMFQAPMGSFQLESKLKLWYLYFQASLSFHSVGYFSSWRLSLKLSTLSAGLVGCWNVSSVIQPGLLTVGVQITIWKDESIHWVASSGDDGIEHVSGGDCFTYFDFFEHVYFSMCFSRYYGRCFFHRFHFMTFPRSLLNDVINGRSDPSLQ